MTLKRLLLPIIVALVIIACAPVASAATQAEIDNAISNGVAWLAAQQNADGSWGSNYRTAYTGFAVLKLEDRAIELGLSPFDPEYDYSQNVEKGLRHIFSNVRSDGSISDGYEVYDTSIALMAISESGAPNKVVSGTGNPNADGKTYKEIVQQGVTWLVQGQSPDGGWGYTENYPLGDQSNTGYATLALVYAQKFGISDAGALPKIASWVTVIQAPDGSSLYRIGYPWPNTYKTGSLLQQFKMVGRDTSDADVQRAIAYIEAHWKETDYTGYDQGWKGNYQACYGLMKGFQAQGITTITVDGSSVNWYDDFADWIVASQNADGSWPSCPWADPILSTSWALLTLEKTTEVPPASFDVVKSADAASINAGTDVTYTYLVSNTGSSPISDLVLADDKLGVISGPDSGDTDSDGVLDPLETWTYTATATLAATTTNTATATGKDPDGNGVSVTGNAVTVKVEGNAVPKIAIEKSASATTVYKGDEVTYTYTVTNAGSVPLTDVAVTDSNGLQVDYSGGDANSNDQLDLTETWTFEAKATLNADTTNTATASGKAGSTTVSADSEQVTVTIIDPRISIAKSVDQDIVYVGASVTYSYAVTNPGTGDLTTIAVTDDQAGVIPAYVSGDDGDGILEKDEKWVYTATVTLSDTVTNIGTATGTDVLGKTVTAWSDKVTVLVLVPVNVDIKPGSCPNAFNRQDKGVLPVAIVGTADFDVRTIDTKKPITLNGVRATKWEIRDTATPYPNTDACGCHALGSDGIGDLIVYFPVKSIATTIPGDAVINDIISLNLGGALKDGRTIDGNDCIRIVK